MVSGKHHCLSPYLHLDSRQLITLGLYLVHVRFESLLCLDGCALSQFQLF